MPLLAAATPQGAMSLSKGVVVLMTSGLTPRMPAATWAVVVSWACPQLGEPRYRAMVPFFSSLTVAPLMPPAPGVSFISGKIAMSRAALRPPGSTPMTTPMPR